MLAPWKESYDNPRQHIKKQRHHFANKDPYSQSYGFSSSHVWMWELLLNCESREDSWESLGKRPWCWERLRAGGEGGNRGWNGWIASLTQWIFVSKVMSLLFNMLSRFVIAFLPRSKSLFISWLQSSFAVIFGAQENKVCHCFRFFLIYLPWSTILEGSLFKNHCKCMVLENSPTNIGKLSKSHQIKTHWKIQQ